MQLYKLHGGFDIPSNTLYALASEHITYSQRESITGCLFEIGPKAIHAEKSYTVYNREEVHVEVAKMLHVVSQDNSFEH